MEPEWTEDELWALMLSVDADLDEMADLSLGEVLMDPASEDYRHCSVCGSFVWKFDMPDSGGRRLADGNKKKYKRGVCWRCNSAQASNWYEQNKDRHRANVERWQKENEAKFKKLVLRKGHQRNARLAGIPGSGFSDEQAAAELRRLDNKCALCGVDMVHYSTHKEMLDEWSAARGKKYWGHPQYRTLEHKKPVASGNGSNRPEDLTFTCSFCNKGVGSWEYRVERAKARKEGK